MHILLAVTWLVLISPQGSLTMGKILRYMDVPLQLAGGQPFILIMAMVVSIFITVAWITQDR
ncbi:Uncharacterised protein [Serratia liquefaciens]|nr:Uncharacterised protein [Serratia liquefaciens]